MKAHRDAATLAAALTNAAAAPVPLPERVAPVPANSSVAPAAPPQKPAKAQTAPDTVGITLRPDRALLKRYTNEAADRTRKEGKVISAQQIMLEVLARGLQVKP
jgi:hypothetical protein